LCLRLYLVMLASLVKTRLYGPLDRMLAHRGSPLQHFLSFVSSGPWPMLFMFRLIVSQFRIRRWGQWLWLSFYRTYCDCNLKDLRDLDYVTGNMWLAWYCDHDVSLSLESVPHFMVSMIFSAHLIQAVSHTTLHNDVTWRIIRLYLKFI